MDTQAADQRLVMRLIVFSDEWGAHPSSAQHLVRHLLPHHPTVWVNTIGMRRPGFTHRDAQKMSRKVQQWLHSGASVHGSPPGLRVITPIMWPGFRWGWEQRLNRHLVGRRLRRARDPVSAEPAARRVGLTTLPIAATLIESVDADAWVYYCVDDFSLWPGLDGRLMEELEQRLLDQVGVVVAASSNLQQRFAAMGRDAELLTHGVDLDHWRRCHRSTQDNRGLPQWVAELPQPIIVFWGLLDQRLDLAWIRTLQDPQRGPGGSLILIGPSAVDDSGLRSFERVFLSGPVPYESLPRWAARADVLVMPYADLPVTRAMQPLKLKEYLATGKPVVVRNLPSTREWADAADVVETADDFVSAVSRRVRDGVPAEQLIARRRLSNESWDGKAERLESILLATR